MRFKALSDYEFSEIKAYNQYNDVKQFTRFVEVLNDFLKQYVADFLADFQRNINLKDKYNKDYATFYLLNYFGISSIPAPSADMFLTKNLYDDAGNAYDEGLIYDDILSTDKNNKLYSLPVEVFVAIASFMLNYKYPVFNLDCLCELLKVFYEAYTGREFVFAKQIIVKDADDSLKTEIHLPNVPVWQVFYSITRFSPDLVGLPYGKDIEFQLDTDRGIEA